MRRKTPDAILLSVGINDTARVGRADGRPQLSEDAFGFGMRQLLAEVQRHCRVFVTGLTPVDDVAMPFAGCLWYSNAMIQSYRPVLPRRARNWTCHFWPSTKRWRRADWLQWMEPDGLHLNDQGHQWLHQRLSSWPLLLQWAGLTLGPTHQCRAVARPASIVSDS